jgi:hypothetical protein
MRRVTIQEFNELIEVREDVFAAINAIFGETILPDMVALKDELIREKKRLTYDVIMVTKDKWGDDMPCAAVTEFWWKDGDETAAGVNHFLVFNDDEEMMRHYGSGKMKELDLPEISPN